jgi:hypothetical protein
MIAPFFLFVKPRSKKSEKREKQKKSRQSGGLFVIRFRTDVP